MDFQTLGRLVSILAGAVVLFGLEVWFAAPFYIAIPAGNAAYTLARVGFALAAARQP